MNRYIFIHRLIGPAILMLLGLVWLLSQAHLVRFGIFVPLLLILLGVLKLAERAALSAEPYGDPYYSGPYGPAAPYGAAPPYAGGVNSAPGPDAMHPATPEIHAQDYGKNREGGNL